MNTFKVGERVFTIAYGYGIITHIGTTGMLVHSNIVGTLNFASINEHGISKYTGCQVIFYDEPVITIPKRKIKKWKFAYYQPNKNMVGITVDWLTETEAAQGFELDRTNATPHQKLIWTEIEVEETC